MMQDAEFIARARALEEQSRTLAAQFTALVAEYDAPPPPPERYVVEAGASLRAALALDGHTRYTVEGDRTEACVVGRDGLDLAFSAASGLDGAGNEALRIAAPNVCLAGGLFRPGATATGATVIEAGAYNVGTTGTRISDVFIDGCYRTAHGLAIHSTGVFQGVTVRNVGLPGRETHGIWGNDIPAGGVEIVNFDIEAAGVGIFFGGANFNLGYVPRGVVIRQGVLRKLDAWMQRNPDGTFYIIKNAIEFKGVEDALVEDVLIVGNWRQGQDGDTIVIKCEDQYGNCPFTIVRGVTLRRVRVLRCSGGITIGGPNPTVDRVTGRVKPNMGTHDVTIEDCELHIDRNIMGFQNVRGTGRAIQVQGPVPNLKVRRSLFDTNGSSCLYYVGSEPSPGAEFIENTWEHGTYGFTGDNVTRRGDVVELLEKRFPGAVWQGNTVNVRQRADGTWPFYRYPEGTNIVRIPYVA